MSSIDPIFKWGIPVVVMFTALVCFAPWLKKSDRLRWLCAFVSAVIIAPVLEIGCPGMSIEPLWVVLTTWQLSALISPLGLFVVLPLVLTTPTIYFAERACLWMGTPKP